MNEDSNDEVGALALKRRCLINEIPFHPNSHHLISKLSSTHIHKLTTMTTPPTPTQLRSLYRLLLRELPPRALSPTSRTPLQTRIREHITSPSTSSASSSPTPIEHADQFLQFVRAQRMYATLVERYNPGLSMDEEDRVRLTARRVGMDLPEEFKYVEEGEGE